MATRRTTHILLFLTMLLAVMPMASSAQPEGFYPETAIALEPKGADFYCQSTVNPCDWGCNENDNPGHCIYYRLVLEESTNVVIHNLGSAISGTEITVRGDNVIERSCNGGELYDYMHASERWKTQYSEFQDCFIALGMKPGEYYIVVNGRRFTNAGKGNGPVSTTVIGFHDGGTDYLIGALEGKYAPRKMPYDKYGVYERGVEGSNYTRFRTYLDGKGLTFRDEFRFYDGLGRTVETVHAGASTDGGDIAETVEYDSAGMVVHEWLPIRMSPSASHHYDSDELAMARPNAAVTDGKPYTTIQYDGSPLGRTSRVYGIGEEWHDAGRSVSISYVGNTQGGDLQCGLYYMDGDAIVRNGLHDNGALAVTRTTDEDNRTALVFTDALGRTVLQRRIADNGNADTYHVYYDNGLLAAVLPPAAADAMDGDGRWPMRTAGVLHRYAYLYEYDDARRCVARKLPGRDWTRYAYDACGTPVMSQDGNRRRDGLWEFTVGDQLGRKVLVGECQGMTGDIGGNAVYARMAEGNTGLMGYALQNGVQVVDPVVTEAMFYDDYSFVGRVVADNVAAAFLSYAEIPGCDSKFDDARGLQTGSVAAMYDGDGKVSGHRVSAYYYDDNDRIIQTATVLPGVFTDRRSFAYDFEGHVTKSLHRHTTATGATSEETDAYTYDSQGRLLTHTHGIDGGKPVLLARNTYDELGRLAMTERGRSDRLDTRMEYDIRSNLTKIGGTLFTETLYYNRTNEGNTPQYGGNVSAIDWETYNDGTTRPVFHGYNFTYDALSRLTAADYLKNGRFRNNAYGTRYTYDIMGNAMYVRRNGLLDDGTYGPVDDLTLHYDGNQLTKVTDAAEGPYRKDAMHYIDGADAQEEFAYDANGNMTRNLDRHICSIRYNSLNLPRRIEFTDGSIVRYTYAATGEKLRVDYHINPLAASASAGMAAPRVDSTSLVHTWCTYTGNRIYDNDSLHMLLIDGGYITFIGGKPLYHFYLRDHLGNNRVVADIDGNVEEVNHYYPYGALMDIGGNGNTTQPYKYVGKELDRTHGLDWYDHGARMNDPLTLRWNGVDKRAEEKYDISPYNVCDAKPIVYIDDNGEKTYLYATKLPGFFSDILYFATHTFLVVTDNKGKLRGYFAYGSDNDGMSGVFGGKLGQQYYEQDINIIFGKETDNLKAKIEMPVPKGLTSEEFDNRVIRTAKSFGNNKGITYNILPQNDTEGNCNTSTSTILIKSGVGRNEMEKIKEQIPGTKTGFNTDKTKPWTVKEQKEAVEKEKKSF